MKNALEWFSQLSLIQKVVIGSLAAGLVVILGSSFSSSDQAYEFESPVLADSTTLNLGMIYVHVAGEVASPGLYQLEAGSRVEDAISVAGGMTAEAFEQSVNLARMVSDGEQIVVLAKGQIASGSSSGFISLNSADQEQLESLPGVGPSLASAIIEYRSQIGSFADLEQLREVSGIGPKLFAKITAQLTL
jgi:competence protein ComEA